MTIFTVICVSICSCMMRLKQTSGMRYIMLHQNSIIVSETSVNYSSCFEGIQFLKVLGKGGYGKVSVILGIY
jgi:hypothetical protein